MREQLHGPAGLKLGGRGPEVIALSIIAQMQQVLAKD
jgi:xanthine/CO dehydrogenase XdhC/CoxF family maturation factor